MSELSTKASLAAVLGCETPSLCMFPRKCVIWTGITCFVAPGIAPRGFTERTCEVT